MLKSIRKFFHVNIMSLIVFLLLISNILIFCEMFYERLGFAGLTKINGSSFASICYLSKAYRYYEYDVNTVGDIKTSRTEDGVPIYKRGFVAKLEIKNPFLLHFFNAKLEKYEKMYIDAFNKRMNELMNE